MAEFNDIARWRTHIFSRLLAFLASLSVVAGLPSIGMALYESLWLVAAMDTVALVWVLAIWRLQHLPYHVRVYNFLAIFFLVGIGLMLTIGPVSQIYLMAAPVLGAVLLCKRAALAILFASALSILVLSLTGHSKLYVTGMPEYALAPSLIVTLNYLCIGLLITISCSTLLRLLEQSIIDLGGVAKALEDRQDELQALNAELRLTAAAVSHLNDMVLIARADTAPGAAQPIIFANDAFERRTGYQRREVLGRSMYLLQGAATDAAEVERVRAAMARTEPVTAELLSYTKAGETFWIELDMMPFADTGGANTHWVAVGRDVTERRKAADDIHRLAFFDVLTGLPNRRLLMDRLGQVLAHTRSNGGLGALMFIDLDHFKFINDARGHATGDALLRHASARLTKLMGQGDLVARLGGDEFVVLLTGLGPDTAGATSAALELAEQIRTALTQPFEIDGQSYNSSSSIGVTLLPKTGQTVDDLLREADIAMYRAKARGRNGVALFEETMQAEVQRRMTLERELAAALESGALRMHAQLQVDASGAATGAEMLMRWPRPDGSMVAPDVFIPVAEATGLIVPLGHLALHQACLAFLQLEQAGYTVPLSVNVSPSQFRQADFVANVRAILAETGAPASQLIFEITEGLLIDHIDSTIARMHELVAMGIRFSIDDFGTGYSSFAYLKRMPLYELKIDKSFIDGIPGDANGTAIVQSILAMAGHLGLRVVAEGVETLAQAEFLAANGSPHMQGYLFARPLAVADMIRLLDARP